jgi:hypothetical protein
MILKVTWWKPWRPDPTKSLEMTQSTTAKPKEAVIKPVDVAGIDCNKQSYLPHEKCDKVRKTNAPLLLL